MSEFSIVLYFNIELVTWFALRYHFSTSYFSVYLGSEIGKTQLRIQVNQNDIEGIIEFISHKRDFRGLEYIEINVKSDKLVIQEFSKCYHYHLENDLPEENKKGLNKAWQLYKKYRIITDLPFVKE